MTGLIFMPMQTFLCERVRHWCRRCWSQAGNLGRVTRATPTSSLRLKDSLLMITVNFLKVVYSMISLLQTGKFTPNPNILSWIGLGCGSIHFVYKSLKLWGCIKKKHPFSSAWIQSDNVLWWVREFLEGEGLWLLRREEDRVTILYTICFCKVCTETFLFLSRFVLFLNSSCEWEYLKTELFKFSNVKLSLNYLFLIRLIIKNNYT